VFGGIGFTAPWMLLGASALSIPVADLRACATSPQPAAVFPGRAAFYSPQRCRKSVSGTRTPLVAAVVGRIASVAALDHRAGWTLSLEQPARRKQDPKAPAPLADRSGRVLGPARPAGRSNPKPRAQLTRAAPRGRTVGLPDPPPAPSNPPFRSAAAGRQVRLAGSKARHHGQARPHDLSNRAIEIYQPHLAGFDTIWFSDGARSMTGADCDWLGALQDQGSVEVYQPAQMCWADGTRNYEGRGASPLNRSKRALAPLGPGKKRVPWTINAGGGPRSGGELLAQPSPVFAAHIRSGGIREQGHRRPVRLPAFELLRPPGIFNPGVDHCRPKRSLPGRTKTLLLGRMRLPAGLEGSG